MASQLPLEHLGGNQWGTRRFPDYSQWLESPGARAGDALILQVLDGEARLSSFEFEAHTDLTATHVCGTPAA